MRVGGVVVACALALSGCLEAPGETEALPVAPRLSDDGTPEEPIFPVPLALELDPRQVALGQRLFTDPILSRDRDVACISCHPFAEGGDDGAVRARLPGREPTPYNTPTIFNVGLSDRLNWTGRFESLEAHVEAPMASPRVMNLPMDEALARLRDSETYRREFAAIDPEGVTERTLRASIAAYERSLITPNARFDRFLRGDREALADRELEGYALFKSYGCVSCHQGVNVGGNLLQKIGVMKDFFEGRRATTDADLGHFTVSKRDEDRYVFRVPSLRNVARTAPYFHDGSAATLEEAVRTMGEVQLGRSLPDDDVERIVDFLGTLDGELPESP